MTRRELAAFCGLGMMLGVLLGWCAALPDPPVSLGLGEIPAEVAAPASTTSTSVEPSPAPGEDAWDALPSEDAVYLEALHQSTTTTTEAPPAPAQPAVPAPPPSPPPATVTVEAGPLADLICSYGWDCATALRVAACESGMNPGAVGSAGERGIFQVHPVHRSWLGARWDRLFDPAVNVAVAFEMWSAQGWGPWSCA